MMIISLLPVYQVVPRGGRLRESDASVVCKYFIDCNRYLIVLSLFIHGLTE